MLNLHSWTPSTWWTSTLNVNRTSNADWSKVDRRDSSLLVVTLDTWSQKRVLVWRMIGVTSNTFPWLRASDRLVLTWLESERSAMLGQLDSWCRLGENVGHHFFCRLVLDLDGRVTDLIPHKVKLGVDVLGPWMLAWIARQQYRALVVLIDQRWFACMSCWIVWTRLTWRCGGILRAPWDKGSQHCRGNVAMNIFLLEHILLPTMRSC